MNSNNNPIKTVLLEATSENKYNFKVHLCPEYIDIKCGSWGVAVKDITCVSTRDINKFVNITTNLVDGKKLDKYNQIESFQPPLQRFEIGKKGSKFTKFDLIWFSVNNLSDVIELGLEVWPGPSTPIENMNSNFYVTLLFNRYQ
jgi:hypothetical protein